ncbi:MAG: hypothetical protein V9E94_04115 [Microthrixaceae bacterium]
MIPKFAEFFESLRRRAPAPDADADGGRRLRRLDRPASSPASLLVVWRSSHASLYVRTPSGSTQTCTALLLKIPVLNTVVVYSSTGALHPSAGGPARRRRAAAPTRCRALDRLHDQHDLPGAPDRGDRRACSRARASPSRSAQTELFPDARSSR